MAVVETIVAEAVEEEDDFLMVMVIPDNEVMDHDQFAKFAANQDMKHCAATTGLITRTSRRKITW